MLRQRLASERWLPVVGFETHYEVSDQGRVRSLTRRYVNSQGYWTTKTGKVMSQKHAARGKSYPEVQLSMNGKQYHRLVHRLVAAAFLGARPAGLVICHQNGDGYDNRLANLRYDTLSSNMIDAVRHGTHVATRKTHCPRGHEYSPENTRLHGGKRFCIACRRARTEEAAVARRAAPSAA